MILRFYLRCLRLYLLFPRICLRFLHYALAVFGLSNLGNNQVLHKIYLSRAKLWRRFDDFCQFLDWLRVFVEDEEGCGRLAVSGKSRKIADCTDNSWIVNYFVRWVINLLFGIRFRKKRYIIAAINFKKGVLWLWRRRERTCR